MAVPVSQAFHHRCKPGVLKQKPHGAEEVPARPDARAAVSRATWRAPAGGIQYPRNTSLKTDLSLEECFRAVEECGTPMVSI